MTSTCFTIRGPGVLEPTSFPDAMDGWERQGASVWVHIDSPDHGTLRSLLDRLEIPTLVTRCLCDPGENPRAIPLSAVLFFQMPTVAPEGQCHLAVLLKDRLALVLTRGGTVTGELSERLVAEAEAAFETTPESLVCVVLNHITSTTVDAVEALRSSLDAMMTQATRDVSELTLEEITAKGQQVREIEAISSLQHESIRSVAAADGTPFALRSASPFYGVAVGNVRHASDTVQRFESRVGDLRLEYHAHVSEQSSRRLNALTVLSAVFLPLTLISGIYGMNFDVMPELHVSWGYPVVIGAMAVIATALVTYFWRRGWFG